MDIGTLIGVIGGSLLVLLAIMLKADLANFFDLTGIIVVFGGSSAAILNSFPMQSVFHAFKTSIKIFFSYRIDQTAVLREMIKLAGIARKNGAVALEKYKMASSYLSDCRGSLPS